MSHRRKHIKPHEPPVLASGTRLELLVRMLQEKAVKQLPHGLRGLRSVPGRGWVLSVSDLPKKLLRAPTASSAVQTPWGPILTLRVLPLRPPMRYWTNKSFDRLG